MVYLGADVPLDRLPETLQALRPQWVITAAQYLATVAGLMDLAHLLQAERFPLGYGGRAFLQVPALRRRIPAYFLGERLDEVPQRLEQWVAAGLPPWRWSLLRNPIGRCWGSSGCGKWPSGERSGWALAEKGAASVWLPEFGMEFSLHLQAALATGEMALMDAYLSWREGLRGEQALPDGWRPICLNAFADALDRWVGSIAAFLSGYLRNRAQEG